MTSWAPRVMADTAPVAVDPELRLLAAVIARAWKDLKSSNCRRAGDARAYFAGPNFEADSCWFDLDPDSVRRLISERFAMKNRILTDEQARAIHAEYKNGRSLAELAAEHDVSVTTLHRSFERAGLPRRQRKRAAPAASSAALGGDINQVVAALVAAGRTVTRVTIIDLAEEETHS